MDGLEAIKESRKVMYEQLRSQLPGIDKQILKQMAYDAVRQAVANLKAE